MNVKLGEVKDIYSKKISTNNECHVTVYKHKPMKEIIIKFPSKPRNIEKEL
jgi:hypothetical protein